LVLVLALENYSFFKWSSAMKDLPPSSCQDVDKNTNTTTGARPVETLLAFVRALARRQARLDAQKQSRDDSNPEN
jgi:hypothetical protein